MDGAGGLRITTAGDTAAGEFQREKVLKNQQAHRRGTRHPKTGRCRSGWFYRKFDTQFYNPPLLIGG